MKCGIFSIVGRPNVGKSTLVNILTEQKVSITSRKPNTTRTSVLGVATKGANQIIFVDTPGWQKKPKRLLDRYMNRFIDWSFDQVDCVLMISDARNWRHEDKLLAKSVLCLSTPKILIINKIDLIKNKAKLLTYVDNLKKDGLIFDDYIFISAKKKQSLDSLLKIVTGYCPKRDFIYDTNTVTNKTLNFRISEVIREKMLMFLGDELPYETCVVIEQFDDREKLVRINAVAYVERDSQRLIILGKTGSLIKKISTKARYDIETLVGKQVYLRIWVKVAESWSDDTEKLKLFGLKGG